MGILWFECEAPDVQSSVYVDTLVAQLRTGTSRIHLYSTLLIDVVVIVSDFLPHTYKAVYSTNKWWQKWDHSNQPLHLPPPPPNKREKPLETRSCGHTRSQVKHK